MTCFSLFNDRMFRSDKLRGTSRRTKIGMEHGIANRVESVKIAIWFVAPGEINVHGYGVGAPAPFSHEVRHPLDVTYPGRWIGPVAGSPRSQDLNSLYFFLRSYLN